MWRFKTILVLSPALLICGSCVERYDPPTSDANPNYLIVDAFLNGSSSVATISLSRSISLTSSDAPFKEKNALVTIEDDQGEIYAIPEIEGGVYSLSGLLLDNKKKYRL